MADRIWAFSAILLLALPALAPEAAARSAGPFPVGFRIVETRDLGRAGFVSNEPGRPVTLFVWYPAKAGSGAVMTNRSYFEAAARNICSRSCPDDAGQKAVADALIGLGGAGNTEQAVAEIAQRTVSARFNAEPASGTHPLVIYPAYRGPVGVTAAGEYLASWNYVLVSFALQGANDHAFAASLSGMEAAADDVQFAIADALKWPFVGSGPVGLMGSGIAASSALSYAFRSAEVGTLISLDGGIPTEFEDGLLKRSPFFDPANARTPIIGMMSRHPDVRPALWAQYRYSERTLLSFAKMDEFSFTDYGAWSRDFPMIMRDSRDAAAGYDWAIAYARAALDLYLKHDPRSIQAMEPLPPFVVVRHQLPLPAPPTIEEMKAIVARGGVAALEALADRRAQTGDATPLVHERVIALTYWMDETHHPESELLALARLRAKLFPASARAQFSYALRARRAGDRAAAAKALMAAKSDIASDDDPALSDSVRARIRGEQ